MNLYKYQTTDRFVYRTNVITHKTEYLIGNKEWADLEICYPEAAPAAEVIATSAMKASNEFTQLVPTLIALVGYGTAFYFMTI